MVKEHFSLFGEKFSEKKYNAVVESAPVVW